MSAFTSALLGEEEFAAMRAEWSDLLARSEADCIFLTWEWLHTWWRHLRGRRQLCLLAVRDGARLMALAPMAWQPASLLHPCARMEFLGAGTVGSDYLDFIVDRAAAAGGAISEVAESIRATLAREGSFVQLAQLRGAGACANRIAGSFAQHGWSVGRRTTNVCPFINLEGLSWETYLRSLGSEHRYGVRRKLKNLAKHFAVRLERAATEPERGPALANLLRLHAWRWEERGGNSDAFHTPAHVAFHDEFTARALREGWLRLYTLWLDDQPAASLYGLSYKGVFSFYQSGFDPRFSRHSVGLAMMALAIQSAIAEGAREFDFLHGDEEYKYRWAREQRELTRIELYPPGALGYLHQQLRERGRALKRMARHVPLQARDRTSVDSSGQKESRLPNVSDARQNRRFPSAALDRN